MRVFEITKKYAPAFADFVPDYILSRIQMPGFHTLGEVSAMEAEHYGSGFLQFYDGSVKKLHSAELTYLFVPEEERCESNGFSLIEEMEKRLMVHSIDRIFVKLKGDEIDSLKGYLLKSGFTECTDRPMLFASSINELATERLLMLPDHKGVHCIKDVPKTEVIRTLQSIGQSSLHKRGVDGDFNSDSYSEILSTVYFGKESIGMTLFSELPSGGLLLKMCISTSKEPLKPMLLMLSKAAKIAKKKYLGNTPVFIPCRNEKTKQAIAAVAPEVELKPVWQGEYIV